MAAKERRTPTHVDLLTEKFGEALGKVCQGDASFHQSLMIGFTRIVGQLMRTGERASGNEAFAELVTSLTAVIAASTAAQLNAQHKPESLSSSASTSASTSNLSLEEGKRSTANSKATRSRRVMPAVSAAQSKPLRKKSVEATK